MHITFIAINIKKKEVNKIELNTVYNKNCIKFMKDCPENYFDLMVADPPNPFEAEYKSKKDYNKWTKEWIKETPKVLKDDGSLYLFASHNNKDFLKEEMQKYFNLSRTIYWYFNLYYPEINIIYVFNKKNNVAIEENWGTIHIPNNERQVLENSLYSEDSCRTRLPYNLIKQIIETELNSKNKDEFKLYDLFSGSGIVLECAKDFEIDFVGTELDKKFYRKITKTL